MKKLNYGLLMLICLGAATSCGETGVEDKAGSPAAQPAGDLVADAKADKFGCNYTICTARDPCPRGCKCVYPPGSGWGYCDVWYRHGSEASEADVAEEGGRGGPDLPAAENDEMSPEEFCVASILVMATKWDQQALVERASDELMAAKGENGVTEQFVNCKKLGGLKIYEGARVEIVRDTDNAQPEAYRAKVDFENGPAEVNISLTNKAGEWQISNFEVNSEALRE